MGGSRLSSMSVFLAPPPLNQRPRPGAAVWVTMGPMARSPCNAPRAPVILRRSPRRMSPPGRNRSATSCAAGKESGHRENLLRPEVTAVGVAMAKNSKGWPYWTLVLGAEKANAKKDTEELGKMGKEAGTRAASTAH